MKVFVWACFGCGVLMWLIALALFYSGGRDVGSQLFAGLGAITCFLLGLGAFSLWSFLVVDLSALTTWRRLGSPRPVRPLKQEPGTVRCLACTASNFAGDATCRLCHAPLPKG
jgi:hypothetical protein